MIYNSFTQLLLKFRPPKNILASSYREYAVLRQMQQITKLNYTGA